MATSGPPRLLAPLTPNRLDFSCLGRDFRGGLHAAAVALPMGLAFGVVSGLGPIAGIYSAVFTGIFAALFGGTATQIAGPTGPIAILMASVVVSFQGQPAAIAGVVLLAGIFQIVFGAMQLGRYIALVPYPVTSGFATAVGCIIIVMQLNPLLGHPAVGDTVTAVAVLPTRLAQADPMAVVVSVLCFAACLFAPARLKSIVPVHLVVLVAGSAIVAIAGLELSTMAPPASVVPSFTVPPLHLLPWADMWVAALVLALVGSLDSLLTSVAADAATQQFHDSDRELVGQGLGNVAASLIGALPGSGSTFRTLANIRSGGRTPLSAIIHSLILLALVLGLGQLIRYIPTSVLAGVLIYLGVGIIDWKYIARFPYVPRGGVTIMLTVLFVSLLVNVVTGAAVGFVMASLGFVKRMADMQLDAVDVTDEVVDESPLAPAERAAFERSEQQTLLINLAGPVTFGAANRLYRRLANVAAYRAMVLDFSDVSHIDESGIIALENIIKAAGEHEQLVLVAGLKTDIARSIISYGLSPLLKECPRFEQRLEALEAAAEHVTKE